MLNGGQAGRFLGLLFRVKGVRIQKSRPATFGVSLSFKSAFTVLMSMEDSKYFHDSNVAKAEVDDMQPLGVELLAAVAFRPRKDRRGWAADRRLALIGKSLCDARPPVSAQ